MPSQFFCPQCWKEIDEKADQCLSCGYQLEKYKTLSYEEKLMNALHHPLRENRMIAIQVLGELQSRSVLPLFASLLKTEEDFFVIREIMIALKKIGGPKSEEMLHRLEAHPSRLVKNEAKRLLGDRK
jgi:HEAT repeat protein